MNVLVDTSVWSLALRRTKESTHPKVELLRELLQTEQPIYLLGVILQEILQGIRKQSDFRKLIVSLEPFPLIHLKKEDYIEAAKLRNHCASKGIQAGTIDFLIASTAIRYGCGLLTADEDFARISNIAPLRLL
jgi:predicted nucleic acid-binding protein